MNDQNCPITCCKDIYAGLKRPDKFLLKGYFATLESTMGPLTDHQKKFLMDRIKIIDEKVVLV